MDNLRKQAAMNNRTVTCLDCGLAWTEPKQLGPPKQRCDSCRIQRDRARGREGARRRRAAKAAGEWVKSPNARPGENMVSDTEYRCSSCKQVKLLDEFHRAARSKNGRQPCCKACARDYKREYARSISEQSAVRYRLKKYGLTMPQIEAMLEAQGNRCAICRTDKPSPGRWSIWAIDHCHETGKVRGILCHLCNQALGLLRDNPTAALAAADYLLKHQPESRGTNASSSNPK